MGLLLVEDEDEVGLAETIRDGLRTDGFTTDLIFNGVDGLWAATESPNGADDYLTKPFSFVVLVAHLRALIRRCAPQRSVVLSAGDLRLDPARRRITRGDDEIPVTPREVALLELLMRNAGDVVTKTAIIENVWDASFDGDPNIIEVYVGYIRKKIDHPYGRSAIRTVRGAGYRMDSDGG